MRTLVRKRTHTHPSGVLRNTIQGNQRIFSGGAVDCEIETFAIVIGVVCCQVESGGDHERPITGIATRFTFAVKGCWVIAETIERLFAKRTGFHSGHPCFAYVIISQMVLSNLSGKLGKHDCPESYESYEFFKCPLSIPHDSYEKTHTHTHTHPREFKTHTPQNYPRTFVILRG